MTFTIDYIVREMGAALVRGEGAYFLGSGISAASGLPDWLDLMKDIAAPLGLTLTKYDDLSRIAQYFINADNGNRSPLVGRLKRALSVQAINPNRYHTAIGRTNIATIWTTNFDVLLERALASTRLTVRADDAAIIGGTSTFDIELLKIHGCIDRSKGDELVLTQEDYENFATNRPVFTEHLRHDLLHKSILFVGYSYRDPNIATVLVEARRLATGDTGEHFFIAKQEVDHEAAQRQNLWHNDMRRFGIRTAYINDYVELVDALDRLALASRGKSVFITGSHTANNPLATDIGKLLAAEPGIVLLDGQTSGIGRSAANAFGKECILQRRDIRDRIRFFPNPYSFDPALANDPSLLGTLKQWRASLMRAAHSLVVFDGGMGTDAEVEMAREMDCVIVPVMGAPDGTGNRLLNEPGVINRLDDSYVISARAGTATAQDVMKCLLEKLPQ